MLIKTNKRLSVVSGTKSKARKCKFSRQNNSSVAVSRLDETKKCIVVNCKTTDQVKLITKIKKEKEKNIL